MKSSLVEVGGGEHCHATMEKYKIQMVDYKH